MEVGGAQAAYRVLDVLTDLSQRPEGAGLGELATTLGLAPSTARRLLLVLCDRAFATQDPRTRRYTLGPMAGFLRNARMDRAASSALVRPALAELRDTTTETVFFSIRDGLEVTYLESLPATRSVQMYGQAGMRAPLHATAQGKAILAWLPEPLLARTLSQLTYEPFTEHTLTSAEALLDELRRVRSRGYALNVEEMEHGVVSIASPVLDPLGNAMAAVCVGAPRFRVSPQQLVPRFADPLLAAARRISSLLFGHEATEAPHAGVLR